MRVVAARQTRYTNRLERRSGTLWDGRYKASLIDTDGYLLICCRYFELNPVRARMVRQPEDYRWLSNARRVGLADGPAWLDEDPCYKALGYSPADCQLQYRSFVAAGEHDGELELIRKAVQRN